MKAELTEHEGCFAIELEAETVVEAALIARFAINHTKEIRGTGGRVDKPIGQESCFSAYIVVGKRKDAGSSIPRRK